MPATASARDHPADDLVVSSVLPELLRRRRFVGGTRNRSLPRDRESFWAQDRGRSSQTPAEAAHDMMRGTTRPPALPLLAALVRRMEVPISPSEVVTMSQVRLAISFALSPALIDESRINRFRMG